VSSNHSGPIVKNKQLHCVSYKAQAKAYNRQVSLSSRKYNRRLIDAINTLKPPQQHCKSQVHISIILVHQPLLARKADLTPLALGRDDEIVLTLHVGLGGRAQRRAAALLEEIRRTEPQLHVRQVDTKAAVGAGAEGAVGALGDL